MSYDTDHYARAKKRVKKKKEFFQHLSSYLTMGAFFFLLNMFTSPGDWWFYWPMLGWGIGLGIHYMSTFGPFGSERLNEDWEDREVEKEVRRLERRSGNHYLPSGRRNRGSEEDDLELRDLRKQEKARRWNDDELV